MNVAAFLLSFAGVGLISVGVYDGGNWAAVLWGGLLLSLGLDVYSNA